MVYLIAISNSITISRVGTATVHVENTSVMTKTFENDVLQTLRKYFLCNVT